MVTLYDWITIIVFCAVALTFLNRSILPPDRQDNPLSYIPPAVGCALANWLGNEGHIAGFVIVLAASVVCFWHFVSPLRKG